MATDIVIVGAARTAVGSFSGAFANTPAHDLGAVAIKAALERAKAHLESVLATSVEKARADQGLWIDAAVTAAGAQAETSAAAASDSAPSAITTTTSSRSPNSRR